MKAVLRALLLLVVIGALAGGIAVWSIAARGLSTRVEPTAVEERLARAMRRLATPAAARTWTNPVEASAKVLEDGLEHFADHCAICHDNDGSGGTGIGRGLYPPAPDMRTARTQNLTDGELFSIIENGVRLTGMPAWGTGTPDGEEASWTLVRFIRHLPAITPEELARMEALNPRSPEEFRQQEEERRFLAGEEPAPAPAAPHEHGGRGR